MRRLRILALSLAALVLLVAAADPADVAPQVADEGYFIERGADATDDVVGRAVSDARSAGSRFYAVVLADEPASGATFYADSILDRLPDQRGTVLVVATETVGWAQNLDTWTTDELDRALEASLNGSTSDDVVRIFVDELIEPSSGGGGWILLGIVVIVGAVVAFLVWRGSRARRRREAEQLDEVKAKARAQIDAIANDILDDEDEVAEAANPEATAHFEHATATYADAAERLERAATPQEVLDIVVDLDEAIWHLDAAEALLDGQPVPDKPARPTVPEPRPEPTAPPPASTGSAPPLPTYQRRSGRRSGFGADDMLKTVLAMGAMRSMSGGSRRRSSSRRSGSSGSRSRSSGRSRGGGRRRG